MLFSVALLAAIPSMMKVTIDLKFGLSKMIFIPLPGQLQVTDESDDELTAIFDYFQVEHEFAMKNIEREVALKGGYIPSAMYLD